MWRYGLDHWGVMGLSVFRQWCERQTDGPDPRGEQSGSKHKVLPAGEGISEELAIGPEDWQVFLGPLGLLPATCFLRIDFLFPR